MYLSENSLNYSDKNITVRFVSNIPEHAKHYLIEKLKPLKKVQIVFQEDSLEKSLFKDVKTADILIGWHPSKKILQKLLI